MRSPIVTVIIPTHKRPEFLRRSVESCLKGSSAVGTEVIVVPNGTDTSWRSLAEAYASDARVRFIPTKEADQNIARNVGLRSAHGELVRFLDDDDYLIPDAASAQYDYMLGEQIDVCGGNAELRDKNGNLVSLLTQPSDHSFAPCVLSRNRLQLPFTWVYRRATLHGLEWPSGVRQSEDIVWLIRYASVTERRWKKFDRAVGVWYQHDGTRQSFNRPSGVVHEVTARTLLEAKDTLARQHRWDPHLNRVTADALIELAHRGFPFRPWYWSNVARLALQMDPASRPSMPVYGYSGLSSINPRLLLWLLLPKRLCTLGWGSVKSFVIGRDYRRTL